MDYTDEELEDLATMRALRLRLRACADARIAECEAMPPAKSWLDMNRQIQAITAADRMVVRLYSPPPRRRAAGATASAKPAPESRLASPPHFPNGTSVPGEVAAGASRRVTEGAAPASTSPPPAVETPPDDEQILEAMLAETAQKLTNRIDALTHKVAEWAGIWPDGARFVAGEANWQVHTLTAPVPLCRSTTISMSKPGSAAKSSSHQRHIPSVRPPDRLPGRYPPLRRKRSGLLSLSANLGSGVNRPAGRGEKSSPDIMPWWIVRHPPPGTLSQTGKTAGNA
ncbi:MAG: hypothetical protein WDN06_16920 [Asticcacaulis sp.]